jgi:hypothetical protein
VTVFTSTEDWSSTEGIHLLYTGAEADAFVEQLRDLLVQRQTLRKENPDSSFNPIIFMIDGYRAFFDAIAQQTADRLKALLMVGKGLGVYLIAADRAGEWATLAQFREPATLLLIRGQVLVLGGKAAEHLCVDLGLSPGDKSAVLKPWEGWFRSGSGTRRFKAMNKS